MHNVHLPFWTILIITIFFSKVMECFIKKQVFCYMKIRTTKCINVIQRFIVPIVKLVFLKIVSSMNTPYGSRNRIVLRSVSINCLLKRGKIILILMYSHGKKTQFSEWESTCYWITSWILIVKNVCKTLKVHKNVELHDLTIFDCTDTRFGLNLK